MIDQDKVIVLGGTFPHITLVSKLKSRGYYVILIDYLDHPPAKAVADLHIQESTLDKEKVLQIAKKYEVKLVISTCIDQANVTACYVAEALGLTRPYSYDKSLEVTNKLEMKQKMIDNNINTSKFQEVTSFEDLRIHKLNFPLIVKPVDSNSSKGVKKIESQEKIQEYVNDAIRLSRNGKAIIEEFVKGKEIGIDCYVKNGEAHVLMVKERRKINLQSNTQQIFGCLWPTNLIEENLPVMKKLATDIARVFELDNTPLMIQAIANGDQVNVIEFAPRIGGGESFRIIKLQTGFDFVEAAIDSFLNKEVELDCIPMNHYYAENFIYIKESSFQKVEGLQELVDEGIIEYFDIYKAEGTKIAAELTSNNRVGVFGVKGKEKKDVLKKINVAIQNMYVYNTLNQKVMRKDIYLNEPIKL